MKTLKKHLEKLTTVRRKVYHPLIHKIHKKHKISRKTLFYIKEYGPHTNIPKTIIKESIKILLFASIISSFGGLALEQIKTIFISITPLIILLPILNDMIGDYGTIMSSRFSTMLHEGKIKAKWWANKELRNLFMQVFIISMLTAVFSSFMAVIISKFNYALNISIIFKVFLIAIIDVIFIVNILFFISIFAGLYFYKKKEDPNNFLIPVTTSVADFMNMIILSVLVFLLF